MPSQAMNNQRKFTPQAIIDRAAVYGIWLILLDDQLVAFIPPDLEHHVWDKALKVLTDCREDIATYLQAQYKACKREVEEYALKHPALCFTCLDRDKETPALASDHEGLMYCADHHPIRVGQVSLWKEEACTMD